MDLIRIRISDLRKFSVVLNIEGKIYGNDLDSIENSSKPIIKEFAQNEGSDAFLYGVDNDFEDSLINYQEMITESNFDEFLNMVSWDLDLDDELIDDLKKEADEFKLIQKKLRSFVIFINSMKKAFENQILEGVSLMPISLLCIFAEILIKNTYLRLNISKNGNGRG